MSGAPIITTEHVWKSIERLTKADPKSQTTVEAVAKDTGVSKYAVAGCVDVLKMRSFVRIRPETNNGVVTEFIVMLPRGQS